MRELRVTEISTQSSGSRDTNRIRGGLAARTRDDARYVPGFQRPGDGEVTSECPLA